MSKELIIMNLGIVVATIIAFIFFTGREKLKQSGQYELQRKRKLHNRFTIYHNNVFLRTRFRRIVQMYASLSCYDQDTVKMQSVQLFERSLATALLMPAVVLVTMKDVTVTILVACIGYIYYNTTIEKEIDKIYVNVMKECSFSIQSMSDQYRGTDNVAMSVLNCDKGKLLAMPLNSIYEILTSVDGEERLYQFQRTYPVRILKTLGNVCYIVHEDGDTKTANGDSSFNQDLTALRQECDAEIRRLEKTRIAFKSLAVLSLVGIIIMPIEYLWLTQQIPGTILLIKGMYGMVVQAILILATIIAYYVISVINRPSVVNQIDKVQWIDNLGKRKQVKDFIKNVIPKKYKTRVKLNLLVKDSISSKDMYYIYTSKCVFSVIAFIATFIVICVFTVTARSNIKTNYGSLGFIPSAETTEREYLGVVRTDDYIMSLDEEEWEELTSREDGDMAIAKLYQGNISGLSEWDALNHADRIKTKYETYQNLTFHWWFFLIAYAAALVAWRIPEISLKLRKKLVEYEATEDILQMQTMMIVLSNTKMDVLRALYWLEKQSTIHSAPLLYAYHEYTSDPEGALDRLAASSANLDFKRLVHKLKSAVYTLSLHDSFADVFLDKQQSLAMREMLQGEALESKKNWAKMIAIVPPAISLIGFFILPILILGIQELTDSLSMYM
jgi:hypothetical protein